MKQAVSRGGGHTLAARSKFSKAIAAKILREARAGVGIGRSAQMAGVHFNTLRNWRNEGIKAGRGDKWKLDQELRKVEAEQIAYAEKTVRRAMRHDQHQLNAAKFFLERKVPEEYGRKDTLRIEVDTALRDMLDQCKPLMSAASFEELVAAIGQVHQMPSDGTGSTVH